MQTDRDQTLTSFQEFEASMHEVGAFVNILDNSIELKEKEKSQLDYDSELFQKCSEVLKSWLQDLLDKNVNSMADLVTTGLSHIIDDQIINFKIKQEPKANKISMSFVMEQDESEGDPLDSFGGGAVLIASLILRLSIMSRLNMSNLLIMDEPLNALAKQYIPNCAEFIRQLVEKTGINILMVTHSEEFMNYAHTSYEGRSVSYTEDGKQLHKLVLSPFQSAPSL